MFFGKTTHGAFPLAGGTVVLAVVIGLSLRLDGAPRIRFANTAVEAASSAPGRGVLAADTAAVLASSPRRSHTDAESRARAGAIPATGLRVLSTTTVDYRNDEGTRRRQAGTLVGPMPLPGQAGVVAAGCNPIDCSGGMCPGECSFAIHCDDNNKCTTDTCDIVAGSGVCTGKCVHNPVGNNSMGGCDNGIFCDGKETCQGAVCTVVTAPNILGQPCDTHASCGEIGNCNTGTRSCTAGNVGAPCNNHEDCAVVGRCVGGPTPNEPCVSNATCGGGTCNILGTCAPGTCTNGIPAICCTDPATPTVCAEDFPKCDAASLNAGVGCQTSADCKDGLCERCQDSCTDDAGCSDGRRCNGTETCLRTCAGGATPGIACTVDANCGTGLCLGQCQPGKNPCGAGARCSEKRCFTGATPTIPFAECLYDSECPVGETCGDITPNPPGIKCYMGRCCEPGANPAASLTCTKKTLAECDAAAGNALFYAMDGGEQTQDLACGGWDPIAQIEAWECPKYTSGITQLTATTPPIYPVIIGPVSNSSAIIPVPNGNSGALHAIGDDYTLFNSAVCVGGTNPGAACTTDTQCLGGGRCGSFLALDALRYVGYSVSGGLRLSIDFYDAAGNFVEDVVTNTMSTELGINVVSFTPPLTIPPSGWIVMRNAEDFEPNMRFAMASTTAAGGAGTNYPDALWINTWPGTPASSTNNNFLKMCGGGPKANKACAFDADCPSSTCVAAPGILSFELIGDKVTDPVGACCEANGECIDGVISWICFAEGNTYLGDNSLCARCNGGTQTGNTCRTCSNAPATFCSSDVDCPGGNCQPDNSKCPASGGPNPDICSTGVVGQACTITIPPAGGDNSCDETGVCDLGVQSCINAHAIGRACSNHPDCKVEGTCVAVSCVPGQVCGKGACCKSDPLVCNPTNTQACCTLEANEAACTAAGGTWQGFGTECDADSGYEEAQQHCCRIPHYADLRCMSGLNNMQTCTTDADCRFCVGGSHNGEACTVTNAAEPDGCLDVGVCNLGTHQCVGGTPPNPNTCSTDAECPDNSGVCRGRCVNRGTGGDNCEDAYVHVITVPTLSEGPKTITISGSNLAATSTEEEPDDCFDPMVLANDDPGWFEGFSVDKCARVRIDLCCSDPIHQPAYTVLYADCTCQDPITSAPDPYTAGQSDAGQGQPYCDDDNTWVTFPFLQAGTYHYPIFSALAGAHGDYQVHITVQACPTAACCYLACDIGGQYCDINNPCPGGAGTCDSYCVEVERPVCDEKLGYFLAPPNTTANPVCIGSPCAEGSCCTGPGTCKDARENFGNPMTKADCETTFNGIFVGGVNCKGGTCVNGPDDGLSCNTATEGQCASPGTCQGTPRELAQTNPCPVCVIQGSGNCQAWDNSPQMSPSDLGTGSGEKIADDFVPTAYGTLESVCVWGSYVETDLTTPGVDCGGPEAPDDQRADNFRVRVYENDGGKPGGGNCTNAPFQWCFLNSECPPGGTCLLAAIGESTCTRTKAVIPGAASESTVWGGKTWSFQLSFDNPITGLLPGKCYWLEVTNNTPDAVFGEKCSWHWSQLALNSPQGNLYSAAGSEVNGYGEDSQRAWDMAWCLNLDVAPGGCASQPRACCSCQGVCSTTTLNDCDDVNGVWHEDVQACPDADCVPPSNDNCVNGQEVPVGLYAVSTHCATTDGGNPVGGRADTTFQQDVWYFFRPTEDCPLRADGCTSSQNVFDSVIAIYHDASNPTQCVCPLTHAVGDRTLVDASNDDCIILGAETGGVVETDALAGHCYTIRFAGVPGNHQAGRSVVEISCGPPICGDQRRNGAEQCDGLDNANCRTATPSTLCNPNCTCGSPNPCGDGDLDVGEECDPGTPGVACAFPSTCRQAGDPKQCTCTATCSNNSVEEGEECDGTDDSACSGRCRTSENPPVCLCPALVCGNGILEASAGEECEFGLCNVGGANCSVDADCTSGTCNKTADRGDCESGNCRLPGDPLGGCTCACSVVGPDAPIADPSGVQQNRYISFIPGNAGVVTAIRVKLVDLQNAIPPPPPRNFSAFEFGPTCTDPGGCVRWVGPPIAFPDEPPAGVTFKAAALQCTPHYQDWGGVGLLRVYGSETLPSSTYEAVSFAASCADSEDTCAYVSPPLQIKTARWGDVAALFSSDPNQQPNILDIASIVDKWRGWETDGKWQMQLGPNVPDPTKRIDTVDIALVVDAFKRIAYPLRGPITCPYSPSCPDGVVDRGEECDDGNSVNGDGCNASCRAEARTAAVSLVPVLPYGTDAEPYIPGTVIQGNNIFFPLGGQRVWLELRLSGWDPDLNGTPRLETWQVQMDANGFVSGEVGTLAPAVQPCADNCDCEEAFGRGSLCGVQTPGLCAPAFRDSADSATCLGGTVPPCTPCTSAAQCGGGTCPHPGSPDLGGGVDLSMPNFRFGTGGTDSFLDPGTSVYAATLVLDTPDGAHGRFTIGFDPSLLNTYLYGSPGRVLIPITLRPAVITVVGKNRFLTVSRPPTVPGNPGGPMTALRVRMIDLQHPRPANLPQNPPPDLTTFDTALNGVCVGGAYPGHHCDTNADCRLCSGGGVAGLACTTDAECRRCTKDISIVCDDDADCVPVGVNCDPPGTCCGTAGNCPAGGGTCSGLTACTADPVCTNPTACTVPSNRCARWVGKPGTFLESQDSPGSGDFVGTRLQCTPYYHDWATVGRFHVTGAEILPSSSYDLEALASTCMGIEDNCLDVSDPVRLFTARFGDVAAPFNPPATSTQPDALDVAQVVNKLKNLSGALVKAITQIQPNLPELNADVNALDIVAVVDGVRGFKYGFSGPCVCPSTVTCGGACGAGCPAPNLCVKTCTGGTNDGDPCIKNTHCPGGGTCGTPLCRDRCGRCTP